ncbi:MAG: 16S rRNA (cytidine(1402)-2'-O)-methyltransferase [Clostridia bacterium]|nr:16S rRNA (cytidine(1402)-2'-O)-methyltransferase [Clostridia bacterium]
MSRLYVVATPIGNLEDLSPRAVGVLRSADLILAEDTRVTMKLCQVFDFHAPLISCHRHNEGFKARSLAERIFTEDLTAALVTDAGTPCISDPGNEVVSACVEAGVSVTPVPGCCAGIAAVSISGFDAREFAFYGFLPRERKALKEKLSALSAGPRVAVLHESPHRIIHLTEAVQEVFPDCRMTVCCDLTKKFEQTIYGKPESILERLRSNEKTEKGEYCVVLELPEKAGGKEEEAEKESSPEAKLIEKMKEGYSLREAQELLCTAGEKKNAVKQAALTLKKLFEQ